MIRKPPIQPVARFSGFSRREFVLTGLGTGLLATRGTLWAASPSARAIPTPQPYFASLMRVMEAMRLTGEPLKPEDEKTLLSLAASPTPEGVRQAENILEPYTLLFVRLDQRGLGDSKAGGARPELVEQGWRTFLIRVENPHAIETAIDLSSDAAFAEGSLATRYVMNTASHRLVVSHLSKPADYARKWMGYAFFAKRPIPEELSGAEVEYRLLLLYSRDRGERQGWLAVSGVDAPWIELWEKNGVRVTFSCLPAIDLLLGVRDHDGVGTTASFVIRDQIGRVYPAPAHRLEPDLDFQPQVYRADGESVRLPPGQYQIEVWRGPEYVKLTLPLTISDSSGPAHLDVKLDRWIDAAALGWYPGDTHIHASGCAHYEVPTAGVTPETMIRHVRGEALTVGDVLTWQPGYYEQKKRFTAHVYQPTWELENQDFQAANNASLKPKRASHDADSMVRYDVEVSGFPSSHSGHPVLLRLTSQDYPGAASLEEWPSWNLPVMRWARAQGAVAGYGHCGDGMSVKSSELPNYELPAFDFDGANEFVVDVTAGAVDFVSCVGNPPVTELNFWYHALNCGFQVPMVGETDFPCMSGERVGMNRTYVGLEHRPVGDEGFSAWVEGIKRGRVYFGDGRSHFIDYRLDKHPLGARIQLRGPGRVTVHARVAARLGETPLSADDDHLTPKYGYWHLERARIGSTRTVPLEVVVNAHSVLRKEILADGVLREFSAEIEITQSSWVALRILPSGHTAPIYVEVDGKPTRTSRRSAQWSLDCIDEMWRLKGFRIRESEREAAEAAYEEARTVYRRIKSECLAD